MMVSMKFSLTKLLSAPYRYFSFWGYLAISGVLWVLAQSWHPKESWRDALLMVPVGVFAWTIIEYGLHRFIFHWQPKNQSLANFTARFHLNHHKDPHDLSIVLVAPLQGLFFSSLFVGLFLLVMPSFKTAVGLITGVWLGFYYYEYLHYQIHASSSPRGVLQRQRRDHLYHHFANDECCFGVTSPLWDIIFRTYRFPAKNITGVKNKGF